MALDDTIPMFHWADYLVLGLFFLFTAVLGMVVGYLDRKKMDSKSFLLGGGDMHYVPVALSMQASYLSAIYIMATPTEIYRFGTLYVWLVIAYIAAVPITAHGCLPIYHRLGLTSAYEYLERRFNRSVRTAGALTYLFMAALYMAVVLYTPALALAQVTGLSVSVAISVCGAVCVIYTVLGGLKATIYNDFTQMIVIGLGLIMMLVLGIVKVGWTFWDDSVAGGRVLINIDPDPTVRMTVWTQVIGGTVMTMTLASSQASIQKFLSVKKLENAQKASWINGISATIFLLVISVIGLIMYSFYAHCDPVLAKRIERVDQMVPLFIMELLGHLHGLPGLLLAATFSASLSSLSGGINSMSAVTLIDFVHPIYKRFKGQPMQERTSNLLSRALAFGFGCMTIALGFAAQYFGDLVLQMALSIFGFAGGPVNAVLVLGMFMPFVNSLVSISGSLYYKKRFSDMITMGNLGRNIHFETYTQQGALAALLCSLGISTWIAIGALLSRNPPSILARSTDGCPNGVDFGNNTMAETTTSAMSMLSTTLDYTTSSAYLDAQPSPSSVLWIYRISYMYYSVVALIVAVVVGVVVSLITGRAKNTPANLTFRWSDKLCCCCPRPVRDCLSCGTVDADDVITETKTDEFFPPSNGVYWVETVDAVANGESSSHSKDVDFIKKLEDAMNNDTCPTSLAPNGHVTSAINLQTTRTPTELGYDSNTKDSNNNMAVTCF